MVKKKRNSRRHLLRTFARAHVVFTLLFVAFYVAFGIFGDLSMLARDLKSKYAWAASTTISVYVLSTPEQPVLIASSGCLGEQALVNLSWNATAATDYYDILRDGQPLVSGLAGTSYVDNVVIPGTSYSYVVIAHGSLGSISSVPRTVTVSVCEPNPPLPDPQCEIISLDGAPIDYSKPIRTENRMPKIAGTTNMPNAIILINIYPGPIASSTLTAGSNGYWEYSTFSALPIGIYTFQVTAIDPDDSTRRITKTVQIEIIKKDDDDDDDCGKGDRIVICHKSGDSAERTITVNHSAVKSHLNHGDYCGMCINDNIDTGIIDTGITDTGADNGSQNDSTNDQDVDILSQPEKNLPLIMRAEVINKDKILYSDQDIFVRVLLDWKKSLPQGVDLFYEIIDENGRAVASIIRKSRLSDNNFDQIIPLPKDIAYGKYTLRVRTKIDGMHITTQDNFIYKEAPMVNLSGSVSLTYSELLSYIGWLAIIFFIVMVVFIIILMREYFLYKRSERTVSEIDLERDNFISKRKGVSS